MPRQAGVPLAGVPLAGVVDELLALAAELDAALVAKPSPPAPDAAGPLAAAAHVPAAAAHVPAAPAHLPAPPADRAGPAGDVRTAANNARAELPAGPRVELGFADGSFRMLDPACPAARAVSELVSELTRGAATMPAPGSGQR